MFVSGYDSTAIQLYSMHFVACRIQSLHYRHHGPDNSSCSISWLPVRRGDITDDGAEQPASDAPQFPVDNVFKSCRTSRRFSWPLPAASSGGRGDSMVIGRTGFRQFHLDGRSWHARQAVSLSTAWFLSCCSYPARPKCCFTENFASVVKSPEIQSNEIFSLSMNAKC